MGDKWGHVFVIRYFDDAMGWVLLAWQLQQLRQRGVLMEHEAKDIFDSQCRCRPKRYSGQMLQCSWIQDEYELDPVTE